MEFVEFSAKTVQDAITEACTHFIVTSSSLEYEVVEEGSSGFLGIGSKPAVIKARVKSEEVEEAKSVFSETSKEEKKENKEAKKENKKEAKAEVKKEVPKKVAKAVDYASMTVAELKEAAKKANIEGYTSMKKAELVEALSK